MKLGVIGQCKGGNAVLWFELFNEDISKFGSITKLKYICRNENQLKAKFAIKKLYGNKPCFENRHYIKFRRLFFARVLSVIYLRFRLRKEAFDVIHIQGNYSPTFNMKIIDNCDSRIVLQIMGSDFYQNYLNENLSKKERLSFIEVLKKCDFVICSRESSRIDLLNEFPFLEEKIAVLRLGTSKKWLNLGNTNAVKQKKSGDRVNYLSTRGLYHYNNVDILVEAFCRVFRGRTDVRLSVINGYGNHKEIVDKVRQIIIEYKCEDIVELIVDEWVSEEKLMEYYQQADFNFCIGSTDQLSISITYGLLTATRNVLSPLNTYKELRDSGYTSLEILKNVDVDSLVYWFSNSPDHCMDDLLGDREKAGREHISTTNFSKFIKLYEQVLHQE